MEEALENNPKRARIEDYCIVRFPRHGCHYRFPNNFNWGPEGFFGTKMTLLKKRKIQFDLVGDRLIELKIFLESPRRTRAFVMKDVLQAARIWFLDQVEFYFVEDDDFGPFSPINELESLSTILFQLRSLISNGTDDAKSCLQGIEEYVLYKIELLTSTYEHIYSDCTLYNEQGESDPSCNELVKWAVENHMKGKLMIAHVSGAGKGLVATEDIEIGDVVLEVPLSLVISHDLLKFPMHEDPDCMDLLTTQEMLQWIMNERFKEDSKFKVYFETLPKEFKIGLFFSHDAKLASTGSQLCFAIRSADQLARVFLDKVKLKSDVGVSHSKFNWARGLWFSHGIKALLPNGTRKRCLVPFAGFFNHSLFPHVLHCEWGAESLKFIASRHCRKGAQCYLSYGNLSGHELALDYGFLPKGINYNDALSIYPNVPGYDSEEEEEEEKFPYKFHWVRGALENGGKVRLPNKLLEHLKSRLVSTNEDLRDRSTSSLNMLAKHALEQSLSRILWEMKDIDPELRASPGVLEKPNWDVELARDYQAIQRSIIESCMDACNPWSINY